MQNNNQQLVAGQIRMLEHIEIISNRYRRMCQELSDLGYEVHEGYRLDELLFDPNRKPTQEIFGIQMKNICIAMQIFSLQLNDLSTELKQSTLFDMEPSMHTGKNIIKTYFFVFFIIFFSICDNPLNLDHCKDSKENECHQQQMVMNLAASLTSMADVLAALLRECSQMEDEWAENQHILKENPDHPDAAELSIPPAFEPSKMLPGLERPMHWIHSLEQHKAWFERQMEKQLKEENEAKKRRIEGPSTSLSMPSSSMPSSSMQSSSKTEC